MTELILDSHRTFGVPSRRYNVFCVQTKPTANIYILQTLRQPRHFWP